MKIRTGFVSNSSSSSFVLMGKKINTYDELLKAKNPHMIGKQLCEGQDVFELKKSMLEMIADFQFNEMIGKYEFYDSIGFFDSDCGGQTFKRNDMPDEFEVNSGTMDQNSCWSDEEFKERYIDEI